MYSIYRDDNLVHTCIDHTNVLDWFHRNHSYSLDHGVRYEGYRIEEVSA